MNSCTAAICLFHFRLNKNMGKNLNFFFSLTQGYKGLGQVCKIYLVFPGDARHILGP